MCDDGGGGSAAEQGWVLVLKKALITGIGGQDGSYLAELLLSKGYAVHGIELHNIPLPNLAQVEDRITVHQGSLLSHGWLTSIIADTRPDECYHLAASSFVSYRFDDESLTLENNIVGTHNLLATLKDLAPQSRFFFAGTSEMFGTVDHAPQDETTALKPRSIYGISKVAGHNLVQYYRQQHGYYACTGILYNHESPRRGPAFVTRKITSTAAKIKLGLENKLVLGNLDAERDWGYAPDYVQAMWLMLQADNPGEYVLSSGALHTVRDFVEAAFTAVGLDYREFVEMSPEFYREKELIPLCGNSSRINAELGWQSSRSLQEMVAEMVETDLQLAKTEASRSSTN